MNWNALNAVAALTILNPKRIPQPLRLQGVVLASAIPGALGLAVPLAIANRHKNKIPDLQANVLDAPMRASVPDLTVSTSFDDAVKSLKSVGLVGREEQVLSLETQGNVVSQSPHPKADVPQGTEVVVRTSQGQLPLIAPPADIEKDLDEKIDAAVAEIEANIKANLAVIGKDLDAIKQAIDALNHS